MFRRLCNFLILVFLAFTFTLGFFVSMYLLIEAISE